MSKVTDAASVENTQESTPPNFLRDEKHLQNNEKRAKIAGNPVQFFDNKSIDFDPLIDLRTIPEVARLLKISIPGVRRLQQGRHIPFHKVGGSVRFAIRDILDYLQKHRVIAIE